MLFTFENLKLIRIRIPNKNKKIIPLSPFFKYSHLYIIGEISVFHKDCLVYERSVIFFMPIFSLCDGCHNFFCIWYLMQNFQVRLIVVLRNVFLKKNFVFSIRIFEKFNNWNNTIAYICMLKLLINLSHCVYKFQIYLLNLKFTGIKAVRKRNVFGFNYFLWITFVCNNC